MVDRTRAKFKPGRWILLLLLLGILYHYASDHLGFSLFAGRPSAEVPLESRAEADDPPDGHPAQPKVSSGYVDAGQSFYDLVTENGGSDADVIEMARSARKVFNLKKIKAGRSYEITPDADGTLKRFIYETDAEHRFILERDGRGWSARMETIQYDIRTKVAHGRIESSLYLSLQEACEDPVLAVELADIYAWDIDFALDLREGDAYGILYEQRWADGRYIGPGRILAARFINQGQTYDAVYFEDRNGYADYYDGKGESLQKQFLKSPLRFKYISSYFSRSRMHPILKIRRPHLGVDYAAPYGTPVRASADGRVIFVGRKGGMGKMIKIRHNGAYTTAYGHLSRYAKRSRTGRTVSQGDVIGYVGSTGLSTGPHLHYSFYRNGHLVNPMRIRNPKAKPVPAADLSVFKKTAREELERVNPPRYEPIRSAGR
jgi:murein DD-endopeptidase MepM/ murein hydrolase activator NlpD